MTRLDGNAVGPIFTLLVATGSPPALFTLNVAVMLSFFDIAVLDALLEFLELFMVSGPFRETFSP